MLTALLFYFGLQHALWFFQYFGVNFTVMGLTAQDYLIRSVDGMFVPLTGLAAAVLATTWGYRWLRERLSDVAWRTLLRVLNPVAAVGGLVFVGVSILGVLDPTVLHPYVALPGLSLTVGVLLLARASRQYRASNNTTMIEWAAVFLLVGVGLFWAVGDYSKAVGTGRAYDQEAALPAMPDVVVYSEKSLNLRAPGVRELTCQATDTAYRFRYDGLKLVLQVGEQYLFLPTNWNPTDGIAVVIPHTATTRLEFTQADAEHGDTC